MPSSSAPRTAAWKASRCTTGSTWRSSTGACTVLLAGLGIDVEIREVPFGVPMTTPFPSDHEHAAWDREYVERFWEALDWTDRVLEEFSGWFNGKTSPVHLFWHGLDLAVTRFSGRDAPPVDGRPRSRRRPTRAR